MNRNEAKARLIEYGLTATEAEALVTKAEETNCEPTSRLQDDNDTTIEYKASASADGGRTGVDVFYYPEEAEFTDSFGEPVEDLGNIDWKIDHYATW
jgi:hypothetical protein